MPCLVTIILPYLPPFLAKINPFSKLLATFHTSFRVSSIRQTLLLLIQKRNYLKYLQNHAQDAKYNTQMLTCQDIGTLEKVDQTLALVEVNLCSLK